MKILFTVLLLVLGLLSIVAARIQAPPDHKLVWVSDDNPRRKEQIELFDREQKQGALNIPGFPANPVDGLKLDPNNTGMEKVIVQSIGGVGGDLFDSSGFNSLSAYVRSGVALDITDELKARGLSISDIWPAAAPSFVYDGRVYGMPCNVGVDTLWLNKDLFAKAGVPLPVRKPWTWQEFLQLAHRLTLRDPEGHVLQYGFLADWGGLWQTCMAQWGGHLYSPDGKHCLIDSPDAIAGVQFAHDLIYKEHIMPTPIEEASLSGQGGWGQGTIKWFGAAKGAMALGGRWWLCTLRDQTHPVVDGRAVTPTMHITAVECPYGPQHRSVCYCRAALVNATSPRAKQTIDFLVYLSGKPYNDLINSQADALAPMRKYCNTPEFLYNPDYPEEDYNAVFRDVMQAAVPEETSLYADGQVVQQILGVQMDLVKTDQKSAADALHTAKTKIDAEIQRMITADPTLKRRYDAAAPPGPAGSSPQPLPMHPRTSARREPGTSVVGEVR